MSHTANKPPYYDGSGTLALKELKETIIVIKPEPFEATPFTNIPYFPFLYGTKK